MDTPTYHPGWPYRQPAPTPTTDAPMMNVSEVAFENTVRARTTEPNSPGARARLEFLAGSK